MKKLTVMLSLAAMMAIPAVNMSAEPAAKEKKQKIELPSNIKFYGFIRNYFAFDTRESKAGTGDLFYYTPLDNNYNANGEDLNAQASFRFLSLTSRLGVDVTGYQFGRTKFGAKIETDFYSGLTSTTTSTKINGTAQLRLRQAYVTIGWDDMKTRKGTPIAVTMKIGQAWHPMAADQPHVFSLETGAPFNAFSRTPQVLADANFGKNVTLSAAAIWQMQYMSQGPAGASAEYIKYSCIPEMYLGLTLKSNNGFLARIGTNLLSIKPRRLGTATFERNDADPEDVVVKVSDRITTLSPYLYLQYKSRLFEVKAKTIFSQGGEHMNLMSGYGISEKCSDGHYEYTPFKTSSTWASMSYGKKWQVMLMGGYIKNLGTVDELVNTGGVVDKADFYFSGNTDKTFAGMWRVIPSVAYNAGKFTLGLEYNYTAARFGNGVFNVHGLSTEGRHNVENHRVQMMVKFTF
ncbi:MAG: hypothetical protein ACI3Z0_04815 [Candidatus Cryptobacteroides sp.]